MSDRIAIFSDPAGKQLTVMLSDSVGMRFGYDISTIVRLEKYF
jgi:hypothetical protein